LSAIAFSEPGIHALLRTKTLKRCTDRILPLRRHLSMPTWWPFQENLSGCTIYAGCAFEIFPMRPTDPSL
jgi:hypothetical protein